MYDGESQGGIHEHWLTQVHNTSKELDQGAGLMRYRRYYTTHHSDGSRTVVSTGPLWEMRNVVLKPVLFLSVYIGFAFVATLISGAIAMPLGIHGPLPVSWGDVIGGVSLVATIVWWYKKVTLRLREENAPAQDGTSQKGQVKARKRYQARVPVRVVPSIAQDAAAECRTVFQPYASWPLLGALQRECIRWSLGAQSRHRARLGPAERARFEARVAKQEARHKRWMGTAT
ncbi:MAG: hypothetical protein ACYDEY_13040 [Acidimicrobiales bacterium]